MALREYLEQREKEVLEQMLKLHRELRMLGLELAEIRTARGAIEAGSQDLQSLTNALILNSKWKPSTDAELDLIDPLPSIGSLGAVAAFAQLTIKELVVKALEQKFKVGATVRDLADFFRDEWNRHVERASLSPQLTRLFQEGTIGRIRSSKRWFLLQKAGVIVGFRPYLDRGRILFKEHGTATLEDEPLLTRDFDGSDDRMPFIRRTTVRLPNGTQGVEKLVWLMPHEIQANDAPALRHEVPADDDDQD